MRGLAGNFCHQGGHARVFADGGLHMELATPDLSTAAAALITAGARAIRVVPLFLGMGKHAREDLPHQLEALRQTWPHIDISLARIVGEEPELVDLLARIAIKS